MVTQAAKLPSKPEWVQNRVPKKETGVPFFSLKWQSFSHSYLAILAGADKKTVASVNSKTRHFPD